MKERTISVVIKGEKYLMNKYTPQDQGIEKKKKKVYVPKDEAEKKTNRTKDGKLFCPSRQIKATLMHAAAKFKIKGQLASFKETMAAGIMIGPEEIPFNPQEYEIAEHNVVINRCRVPAWRPVINNWELGFVITIVDDDINPLQVKEIFDFAGRFKGIGDWRPEKGGEYGKFTIEEWKVKEN